MQLSCCLYCTVPQLATHPHTIFLPDVSEALCTYAHLNLLLFENKPNRFPCTFMHVLLSRDREVITKQWDGTLIKICRRRIRFLKLLKCVEIIFYFKKIVNDSRDNLMLKIFVHSLSISFLSYLSRIIFFHD